MKVIPSILLVSASSLVISIAAQTPNARGDIKVNDRENASRPSDSRGAADQPHDWPDRPRSVERSTPRYAQLEARLAFANNDALRKVQEVTWECVLISPDTSSEISRYTIKSRKKIAAKEGVILKKNVRVPLKSFQPKVVDVNQSGKKTDEYAQLRHAIQQNRIIEIKYTDGSSEYP